MQSTTRDKAAATLLKGVRNGGVIKRSREGNTLHKLGTSSRTMLAKLEDMNLGSSPKPDETDIDDEVFAQSEGQSVAAAPTDFSVAEQRRKKVIALDCEMVMLIDKSQALAQCSIVNYYGRTLFNEYIKPEEDLIDYRAWYRRLKKRNVTSVIPFQEAVSKIKDIVAGKIIIGHGLEHDFAALHFSHPHLDLRDTSTYVPIRVLADINPNYKPSLKNLSLILLGRKIQQSCHCSLEDSQANLEVYKFVEIRWEWEIEQRQKRLTKIEQVWTKPAESRDEKFGKNLQDTQAKSDTKRRRHFETEHESNRCVGTKHIQTALVMSDLEFRTPVRCKTKRDRAVMERDRITEYDMDGHVESRKKGTRHFGTKEKQNSSPGKSNEDEHTEAKPTWLGHIEKIQECILSLWQVSGVEPCGQWTESDWSEIERVCKSDRV